MPTAIATPAEAGLTVRLLVRERETRVLLVADSSDRLMGTLPGWCRYTLGVPYADSLVVLGVQTPLLIGQPGEPWLVPRCGTEAIQIRFDQVFSRTRFDRVLLQAYPSGGCDLFVNGKLIARLRPLGPRSWPDSVRIAVGGRSYRTDMLASAG